MNRFTFLLLFIFPQIICSQIEWKPLKTGAGGWITGMYVHPTGSPIYARSDVGGAYRYETITNDWKQLVTSFSMPILEIDPNRYQGVLSIVGAPSNPNIAYMSYYDGIYKSNDMGETWIKTNFPVMDMAPNDDESKLSGERLNVDPINENVVYFGSINNGLYVTTNGGNSWDLISTVPQGTQFRGIREIKFDKTSGSTNNKTNVIYVSVDGDDIYKSIDAGTTWQPTNIPVNGPVFLDTEISPSGQLYVVGYDQNFTSYGAQHYDGNTWREVYPSNSDTFLNIALDPFDNDRALLFSNGFSDTYQTQNLSNATPNWSYHTKSRQSIDIEWMEWIVGDWFTLGEIQFDPITQNKLWISDGIGTWTSSDLNDDDITWVERSKGQEHFVSNDIVSFPDETVVTAHWDRPLFRHENVDEYPELHQPSTRFNSAWALDQSQQNPNFIVSIIDDHRPCCFDDESRNSGYSEDGGITWTKFETMPAGDSQLFGDISISATNVDNIVWLPANDTAPYFTTNRGVSWTQANIPGASDQCCISANFFSRLALTADKVLANTFYIYDFGNGYIHKSSNGGASWTTLLGLNSPFAYNGKLIAVPNNAGHLFFANGIEESIALIEGLKRSTDGGVTWTDVTNTDKVLNVAIGATEPGANYPTIFIQGEVNNDYGIFKSIDEGQNWIKIGEYPLGIYDRAKVFEANPHVPGIIYIGFAGNGFVYGKDNTLSIADEDMDMVSVHPNPTSDVLTVNGIKSDSFFMIHNILGKKVLSGNLKGNKIDLSILSNGLYLLKVITGETSKTFKIIKE